MMMMQISLTQPSESFSWHDDKTDGDFKHRKSPSWLRNSRDSSWNQLALVNGSGDISKYDPREGNEAVSYFGLISKRYNTSGKEQNISKLSKSPYPCMKNSAKDDIDDRPCSQNKLKWNLNIFLSTFLNWHFLTICGSFWTCQVQQP